MEACKNSPEHIFGKEYVFYINNSIKQLHFSTAYGSSEGITPECKGPVDVDFFSRVLNLPPAPSPTMPIFELSLPKDVVDYPRDAKVGIQNTI